MNKALQCFFIEAIYSFAYSDDTNSSTEVAEKLYIQKLLSAFVDFPKVTFNELHLEFQTSKRVVGGSINITIGTEKMAITHTYSNTLMGDSQQSIWGAWKK